MYNKVEEMVKVLKENGALTENEITMLTYGYDRNTSRLSNKKYADMLRRGVAKGLISRINTPLDINDLTKNMHSVRAKFMYVVH